MSDIVYLKDEDDVIHNIVIFKKEIDLQDFEKKLKEFWEEQYKKEDFEYDEMYDFISENWDVKEFIFINNIKVIYY